MKLNLWEKNGLSRIYVNEGQGEKIGYIEIRNGRLSAVSEHALLNPQAILKQVIDHCGITASDDAQSLFNQIKGFAIRQNASAKTIAGAKTRNATDGKGARNWGNQNFGRGTGGQYASPKPFGRDLAFDNIKNPQPVEIEVDHREPEEIDTYLAQVENVVVTRKHLPLGDFLINGHIVVERKSTRISRSQCSRITCSTRRSGWDSSPTCWASSWWRGMCSARRWVCWTPRLPAH